MQVALCGCCEAVTRPLVLRSIETEDGQRCVDLFRRHDGSFGFEEYRREVEDRRGWAGVGGFGDHAFATEDQARDAAIACVPWFGEAWHRTNG